MFNDKLTEQDVETWLLNHLTAKFITVTLKPKVYKYSSITQLELTNNVLYQILYNCTDSFICVAEHTKQGNVHYHALVYFHTDSSFILLMNKLRKQKEFGFIHTNGNIIQSHKECAKYILKDIKNNDIVFSSAKGRKPYYLMTTALWYLLYN